MGRGGFAGPDGLIGGDTHVLDAPDVTILPAFEDTHKHLMFAAQNMGLVPVDRAHTLAEFIDLIRQRAAQVPPGSWIQTSAAWHEVNLVEGRLPTAVLAIWVIRSKNSAARRRKIFSPTCKHRRVV